MADEPVKTEKTTQAPEQTEEKFIPQSEVDRIISQRLAREKEKFSDYEEIKKRAETLEAEIKKREEAELSENERLKKQLEEITGELESHKANTEWRKTWETKEAEMIEKEMEDLTDNQKTIVNALPLESRRAAINEFKASSGEPAPRGRKGGSIDGIPTVEELEEIKKKYGAGSEKFRESYRKFREARGI